MSGSRLGRGRGGRLALYGSAGVVALLLIFFYRAAVSEMTRLQELHEQCAHQQEALAAQLQVIFEYKVRLEKSLAEEKSSNAAVKQELQQRASQERSLRDKDSIEAMRRFDSLQQTYQLLQTEHQDLQDECKKREKQALDETNKLETTLQDLRGRIRQAHEEKEKLKAKYLELQDEKTQLENKYNELMATSGNTDSIIDQLKKKVFQLQHELDDAKVLSVVRFCKIFLEDWCNISNDFLSEESLRQVVIFGNAPNGCSCRVCECTKLSCPIILLRASLERLEEHTYQQFLCTNYCSVKKVND